MPEDTISIITYEEFKPIADSSGKPAGAKSGGLRRRRRIPLERKAAEAGTEEELEPIKWEYLRKTDVPISKIETELEKLVIQMNRMLPRLESEAESAPGAQGSQPHANLNRRFVLDQIEVHVEINAEGGLSILGTGGKLGGKGGMQLTFKRP